MQARFERTRAESVVAASIHRMNSANPATPTWIRTTCTEGCSTTAMAAGGGTRPRGGGK